MSESIARGLPYLIRLLQQLAVLNLWEDTFVGHSNLFRLKYFSESYTKAPKDIQVLKILESLKH